ncbi:MAG: hypothetical protein JWM39_858 [Parcubacteria group bacterium]|nr:hypothetical protein [Parcubacteria group bacterium]
MLYFIFLPITFALLVLFLLLTFVEAKSGMRMFSGTRDKFDARIGRASFVLRHVDWGAFVNDVTRTFFERALHDIAHGTLMVVRFVERVLTRIVRSLRMRRERILPQASFEPKTSRISETMTYLKSTLRRTRRAPKNLPGQGAQEVQDVVEL